MTGFAAIYEVLDGVNDVPQGLPLLAGLTGFTNAGSAITQIADNIFENFDAELVIEFSNDELLDYRSRRPVMFFDRDHIAEYEPATLGVYLVKDEAGSPFLYLHGYEPDFRWEAFADAVVHLADVFEISSFTWVHSIPFPAPHSRPIGVTVSGNRQEFIDRFSEWKPQTQVPGNVLHLLEYKLSNAGIPVAGYVLLVPHYLADNDYPAAAVAGIERISATTGLVFPADDLREAATAMSRKIDEQVEQNPDLAKLVQNLESGYGKTRLGPDQSPIEKPAEHLPSAEEIASDLEDYLASVERNRDDKDKLN